MLLRSGSTVHHFHLPKNNQEVLYDTKYSAFTRYTTTSLTTSLHKPNNAQENIIEYIGMGQKSNTQGLEFPMVIPDSSLHKCVESGINMGNSNQGK